MLEVALGRARSAEPARNEESRVAPRGHQVVCFDDFHRKNRRPNSSVMPNIFIWINDWTDRLPGLTLIGVQIPIDPAAGRPEGARSHLLVRILLSAVFAAVGVIGLILPVLPGWLFFGFVFILLFPEAPISRAGLARLDRHFPSLRRLLRFVLPPAAR